MILMDKINAMVNAGFKIAIYKNSKNIQVISVKRKNLIIDINVEPNDDAGSLLKKLYATEKRFENMNQNVHN